MYRGKESMKELCKPLIEHAMNIINFEKTKMSSLRPKELKSYKEADKCYIFEVRFFKRFSDTINYKKIETIVTIEQNTEAWHVVFGI